MDISLEQGLASAIRYVQDNVKEGTEFYFGEMPEDYYVPSVYFQPPFVSGQKATLRTYKTEITLNVWFMELETWDAQNDASAMLETILLDNAVFQIVNEDGTKSGLGLRINKPEIRKIDEGIVQLTIPFNAYFHPETDVEKMQKFYVERPKKYS